MKKNTVMMKLWEYQRTEDKEKTCGSLFLGEGEGRSPRTVCKEQAQREQTKKIQGLHGE